MEEQSTESKTHKTLTPEYLEWQAQLTDLPRILTDEIHPKLYKHYKEETGLDPWINSDSSQTMANTQPKINLPELVWQRFENLWNEVKIFSEEEMVFERALEFRLFEDKEINKLVKKLQFNLSFLIIDRERIHDKFYSEYIKLEKGIDELKNENIEIKTENTKLKYDKEEVETENIKLKQDLDEFKKELESKKNRKFQGKCILIAQVLLGEEPVVEYRPSFMEGLELDAFFQHHRIALEVQGAQHRLHHTSWYKDVKKLENIVNCDWKKRCICQDNGIFLLEVWYDEKPEIVIPERIQKIKGFVNQAFKIFDL
ncbi:hypothetical protein Glove_144g53 [Diversispora epigaea]|uniref:Uncharacterized protein n=1 Tax=Diversispora epigaea TaxID=1348612 RepID=A0A397IU12_9GLOM|nr:hypothetical protein Glove_144g53 [Diversispora epigaea]